MYQNLMFQLKTSALLRKISTCILLAIFLSISCGESEESSVVNPTKPVIEKPDIKENTPVKEIVKNLSTAKLKYKTKLTEHVEAPQEYYDAELLENVSEIRYKSGDLNLKAWISTNHKDKNVPAVVFLHGGFAFAEQDWEDAKPFVDAGFVLMMPMLRAENGNPGHFEFMCGEVDDAIAAGNYLKSLSFVDKNRIFVVGHSIGGTLTILVAQSTSPYRMAISFAGSTDTPEFLELTELETPFDMEIPDELRIRNPLDFVDSVNIPLYLFVDNDPDSEWMQDTNKDFAEKVNKHKQMCTYKEIEGDHWTMVAPSVKEAISIFQKCKLY